MERKGRARRLVTSGIGGAHPIGVLLRRYYRQAKQASRFEQSGDVTYQALALPDVLQERGLHVNYDQEGAALAQIDG
jgi:hypothetical protein